MPSENNNAGNQYDAPNQEVVRGGDTEPPKPEQGPKPEETESSDTEVSDTPVSDEAPKRRRSG